MIVEIKQNSDSSAKAIGLDKYNRSKFPGTFDSFTVGKGSDGRWLTGIDEESLTINSILDSEEREKRKAEVRKIREDLERLTNVDLSATNDAYWSKYIITITGAKFKLNLANPQDKIKYYVLIANRYAAPEIAVTNNPEYMHTKYYVSRKDEETSVRVVTRKQKDEAKAKLLELSKDEDKFLLIAKFLLGTRRVKKGMNPNTIYELVSEFIEDPNEKTNISQFLNATKKTVEELQYKLTVDEALRVGIIKIRDGYYQRGGVTYGKSSEEAIDYLSSVENSGEFASLKNEVENHI